MRKNFTNPRIRNSTSYHRVSRKQEYLDSFFGEKLTFQMEPENALDKYAVAVIRTAQWLVI